MLIPWYSQFVHTPAQIPANTRRLWLKADGSSLAVNRENGTVDIWRLEESTSKTCKKEVTISNMADFLIFYKQYIVVKHIKPTFHETFF